MATNLPGGLEYQTAHRSPASVPLPRYLPGSRGYAVGITRASGSSLRLPGSLWSERLRERESSFKNKIMARREGATWFTMRDGGREKVISFNNKVIRLNYNQLTEKQLLKKCDYGEGEGEGSGAEEGV